MTQEEVHTPRWLKSQSAKMSPSKIDEDHGIIYDVVMVEEGPAKGHGVHLDSDFVQAIAEYDKKYFAKKGIKARFGHPSASSETMGTQMGVFKNVRTRSKDGKMQAIADLQLLSAAEESPTHPGMRSWVLKMAKESPDFIMSSIVFQASGYYQHDEEGKKMRVMEYDKDGNYMEAETNKKIFVEFDEDRGASHLYTDLVEQGAATDHLFSTQVNTHLFAAQVDEFLADHPHLISFLKTNPDAVQKWMQRAGYNVTVKKMEKFSITKWLFGEPQTAVPDTTDLSELRTALTTAQTEIKTLRAERDDFEQKFKSAEAKATELQKQSSELRSCVEDLKLQLQQLSEQMAVLSKQDADKSTGGDTPPSGGSNQEERAYKKNPMNKHIYG